MMNELKRTLRFILQTVVIIQCFAVGAARADVYQRFFTAVGFDDGKTVAALLARGFDPNTPSEKGEPALVTAIRDGHFDVAEALMRHADLKVDLPNVNNETA